MSAAPERIHNWQHTQLSIASHYGGLSYQGHGYTIAYSEPGQPLVRDDVLRAEAKAARAAAGGRKTGAAAVTAAEANWRAARTQQLLANGLDKFEAIAQVRQEARSAPWTAT